MIFITYMWCRTECGPTVTLLDMLEGIYSTLQVRTGNMEQPTLAWLFLLGIYT